MRLWKYLVITVGSLLACSLIAFGNDLWQIFENALNFTSGNISNYVLAIPPMVALVLYRKRTILVAVISYKSSDLWWSIPIGLGLILGSMILFFFGSSSTYALYYHIYAMILFLTGGVLVLFNPATLRHAFFALLLLAFLAPLPNEFVDWAAADVSWLSSIILYDSLNSIGMSTHFDTSEGAPSFVLTAPNGQLNTFVIGEPSSGVFSAVGISVFALFVAYISGGRIWKRIALLLFSFPLFFLLNTVRIGAIIAAWYFAGQNAAEALHLVGGIMMAALGTICLLIIGEKVLHIPYVRTNRVAPGCNHCDSRSKTQDEYCMMCGRKMCEAAPQFNRHVGSVLVLLVASAALIYSLSEATLASFAKEGIDSMDISALGTPASAKYLLPNLNSTVPIFAYRDSATENILNQDLAVAFRYQNNSGSAPQTLPVYVGIQISNGRHTWEDSLISYPSSIGRPSAKVIAINDLSLTPTKQARFFMYQRSFASPTEAVLYWFERMPLKFGEHYEYRNILIVLWTFTDNLANQHLVSDQNDIQGTQRYLQTMGVPISNYWDKIESESITATLLGDNLSHNYVLISTLVIVLVSCFLVFRLIKYIHLTKRYQSLLSHLALYEERSIIVATDLCKRSLAVGATIEQEYRKLTTASRITSTNFADLLKKARDAGFLVNKIASQNDVPIMVWSARAAHPIRLAEFLRPARYTKSPKALERILSGSEEKRNADL